LTGGSIVGDMAPYQAFAIGGLGSVRGYGEGAVGSGRLCLIANCEYTVPLVCQCRPNLFYGVFLVLIIVGKNLVSIAKGMETVLEKDE